MKCQLLVFLLLLTGIVVSSKSTEDAGGLKMPGVLAQGGNSRSGTWAKAKAVPSRNVRLSQGRQSVAHISQPRLAPSRELQSSDCLVNEAGNFGTEVGGERVPIYFFYQVEATSGTTETILNGVILDDIEITLVDFLIPRLFDECSLSSGQQQASAPSNELPDERFVGISASPADFVLRGFECAPGSLVPCFVISGSMMVFTVGLNSDAVQAELRLEILRIMSSGIITATIAQVTWVTLLDDSLNPATLPSSQQLSEPTSTIPTTGAPSEKPRTDSPSLPPTRSPSTPPSADSPVSATPTDSPTLETLASKNPTDAPIIFTSEPTTPQPTASPTPPDMNVNETALLTPTMVLLSGSTQTPTNPGSQSESIDYSYHENKSPVEKIPIWSWILICVVVCGCCTYSADPDDDDEAGAGVSENLKNLNEQERLTLANALEEERVHNESDVFRSVDYSVEYARKLYRQ